MSTIHASTAAEALAEQLRADGFQPGAPPHVTAAARRIDREVCEESECDGCGFAGLMYRPWSKGSVYRALAVCPRCQHAVEF